MGCSCFEEPKVQETSTIPPKLQKKNDGKNTRKIDENKIQNQKQNLNNENSNDKNMNDDNNISKINKATEKEGINNNVNGINNINTNKKNDATYILNDNQSQVRTNNDIAILTIQNNNGNNVNALEDNDNNQFNEAGDNNQKNEKINPNIDNKKNILILNENKELEEKKEQNPDYKDMEEWPGDRFMGVGIKKMKGYKCKLCIDELNEKRINFWDEKIKENKDWEIVQKICIFDEQRAKEILEKNNFKLKNNCVNEIIGPDGTLFYVPNFCINDPFFERELIKNNNEEKKIKLILKDISEQISLIQEFNNNNKGIDIKNFFKEKTNLNDNEYKIRIFYCGTEIKNDKYIYEYNLKEEIPIIVMKIKI